MRTEEQSEKINAMAEEAAEQDRDYIYALAKTATDTTIANPEFWAETFEDWVKLAEIAALIRDGHVMDKAIFELVDLYRSYYNDELQAEIDRQTVTYINDYCENYEQYTDPEL